MPVSLFLARREVMDVFKPGDHGSTFGGNPIAAAVGLAALDTLVDERLIERAAALGAHLLSRLARARESADPRRARPRAVRRHRARCDQGAAPAVVAERLLSGRDPDQGNPSTTPSGWRRRSSSRKRILTSRPIGSRRACQRPWKSPSRSRADCRSLHHLADFSTTSRGSFSVSSHDRVQLLAGAGIDRHVALLGGGEEILVLAASRRTPCAAPPAAPAARRAWSGSSGRTRRSRRRRAARRGPRR